MTAVVVDCAYLVGPELELATSGAILIDDGRIAALWRGNERYCLGTQTIRFAGCVALPAMINAHVHLRDAIAAEAADGQPLEQAVMGPESTRARRIAAATSAERVAAMRSALQRAALLGTAAVADFCDGGAQGVAEVRAAAADVPIDVIVLGRLTSHQSALAVSANAPLSSAQQSELDQMLELADGFATATVNDYSDCAWRQIRDRARRAGKMIALHLAEHTDQCATSRALCGRSDMERVVDIAPDHVVHLTQASTETLARVKERGIPVVVCPRSNAMTGAGYPPFIELASDCHPAALGTDNVMLNAPNLWREMEYAGKSLRAARRDPAAITARDLLVAATMNGARALRLDHVLGSIDLGKRADLMIVANVLTPSTADRQQLWAMLAHRVEPHDIVGRFRGGEWLSNCFYYPDSALA
jgi:cytosine/adenosine deaminase-related metal-dependent hydrolase